MHKKIKYIIATTLVIAAVSGFVPSTGFVFGSVEAYASTYNNASNGELKSLDLTWGSGNEIKLYDSYYGDEVDLSDNRDYYVLLQSINYFNISAEAKGSGYVVKVFTSSSKTEKGEDVGNEIDINSTYEDIYLRTYKSEEAYQAAYDDGDVSNCEKTYVIHVRKPAAVSETEQDREYAYLDGITLSNGNIDFSKDQTSYNINVDENVDELTVKANPDDDQDYVEINGASVYAEDNFEKTINLDKGNNTVTIYVQHDNEDTTYTLNVYRGKLANTNNTSNAQSLSIQTEGNSLNAWQRVDGKWKYIDGTGAVLKNEWWFDKDTGANYYLKEDGYRATGWLYSGNNWYYFNENGEMQTGWVNINKNWYYLSKSGAMKTGWIENSDGKWYYLDSTGKMIKDSVVSGYKLGSDGALA
jgi:glucan-binding YG repeat protein